MSDQELIFENGSTWVMEDVSEPEPEILTSPYVCQWIEESGEVVFVPPKEMEAP